jgi:type IV pilus assembly protein PilC
MFLNQHLVVIAPVAFVVGGGLFMFFSRTKRGKELFSLLVHRTPLVKDLLQKLSLQRFAATLSQLLRAGIPFVTAVEITASAVGDRMFSAALLRIARENVAKGVSINDAFKKETIFPNVVINLVSIGERSGRIDEILGTLAEFYEKEIDTSLKNLVSVVEPLMLVVVGIIVAGIAFSVIVPIYQLVGQYA